MQNIPWNKSGRYIVALRTPVRDHLPDASEPADIVLLDTQNDYQARVVDQSRAWNPQQGTMLYWNPQAQETQFFFNDRDPKTNKVFCVLFDISRGQKRRARSRISLRRYARRQRRRRPARRQVPGDQLRPHGAGCGV